jgi:hypothetical protein
MSENKEELQKQQAKAAQAGGESAPESAPSAAPRPARGFMRSRREAKTPEQWLDHPNAMEACKELARAVDPRVEGEERWRLTLAAAIQREGTIFQGLRQWTDATIVGRKTQAFWSWEPLARALSLAGKDGETAARRFSESFGRFNAEWALARLPKGASAADRGAATHQVGATIANAALGLAEALKNKEPGAAAQAVRPWALAAFEHWSRAEGEKQILSVWGRGDRMFRLAQALDGHGAVSRQEVKAFGFAAMDATPEPERSRWASQGHGSLLQVLDRGPLALELLFGLRAHGGQKAISPSEWSAAIGRGPESAGRAETLRVAGVLTDEMARRLVALRSLDPSVRAELESRALRGELGLDERKRGREAARGEGAGDGARTAGQTEERSPLPAGERRARRRL